MPVRRHRLVRALRAFFGALLLTTCSTDAPVGPRQTVVASMDVTGLLRAGGLIPVPVDTVYIELRRASDSSQAFAKYLSAADFAQRNDSLIVPVRVDLATSPEQFYLYAEARGGGVLYYTVRSVVTASAGASTPTAPLAPTYVGPGAAADSVRLVLTATAVAAGDSVLAYAVVYQGGAAVTGVPVGIIPVDSLLARSRAVGVDSAWIFAAPAAVGSVAIAAETPTGLADTLTLAFSAAADSLAIVSGDSQQVLTGGSSQPLVVQVLDAAGQPYRGGHPVTFALLSPPAGATIAPTSTTTDTNGYAQAVVTAGTGTGALNVGVAAAGLKGSPAGFRLDILQGSSGPATITAATATSQAGVVNQLVTQVPTVLVRDSANAPLAGVSVTFAVASGSGSVTGGSAVTNGSGLAALGTWRLGQAAGANTVTATVTGLPVVTFSATAAPTAVAALVRIQGDSQADSAGRTLAVPLVAEVQDTFANPVPGVPAAWSATDGSVTPAADTSDAQGRVQGSWTLGATQSSPTATVVAAGAQTSFTATTFFGQPTILLSFVGIPGVGVGLTAPVLVTLNAPAPVGGTTVSLASSDASRFTVNPASVLIPQGATQDTVVVTGVGAGTATLDATASGYTAGALTVDVQNRNISVPPTLSVPYGQTQSLPIVLPAPAPPGGVTFTVTSGTPSLVGVLTPTVTIAAGGQSANATLSGVLPGASTITVSNPSYLDGTTVATTAAALRIVQTSLTINASFPSPITVNFESNGSATAAPAPGIPVTLTPLHPACVAATSPVTIITGQVSTTSSVSYGGVASLPCTDTLIATATNLQPDSLIVTVNPAPPITVATNFNQVGQGLLEVGSVFLGASNHGGVTVTLTSSDSSLFVLSTSVGTPGTGSITVPVLPLGTSFTYYAHALEGVTGTAVVTATAPGFAAVPDTLTVVAAGIELQGLPTSTTTLSTVNNLYAQVGVPNGPLTALSRVQNHRPGVAPVPVTFALQGGTSVGLIVDSLTPGGAQTGQAAIGSAVYYTPTNGPATGGISFKPAGQGTDSVSVSASGFISLANATRGITVTQPTASLNLNFAQVGVGLQEAGSVFLSASQHNGASVTLSSLDPTVFVLDTLVNGPGHDSIVKTLPNGQTSFTYYVQVKEFSQFLQGYLRVSEPRFAADSVLVTAVQPALDLQGLPASTTTLTGVNNLYAQVGVPNGQFTALARAQNLRGGAPSPLAVTFASLPGGTGILADFATQSTGGSDTVTALIDTTGSLYYTPTSGPNAQGVEFRPQAAGNDTVRVFAVGYATVNTSTRGIAVTQPTTSIGVNYPTLGGGLQEAGSAFLSASQHGGAAVTITSRNPAVILVDSVANGPGRSSFVKALTNGQSSLTIYYQALEGVVDSTWVVISEPRFAPESVLVRTVVPGIDVQGVPTQLTPFDLDANFYAQIGVLNAGNTALARAQNRRGGAPGVLTATFTSSTPAIGTVIDSLAEAGGTGGGATGTARIAPNVYYTPTSGPATGGMAFRPLLVGTTSISVSLPGFTTATIAGTRTVNVLQPGITVSTNYPSVGSGLQEAGGVFLGASQHGGVTVTLTSSDSTILKLAPNATTPGSASIQVPLLNGQTSFSYFAQGMEGISSATTVTITAVASGFTNGTIGMTVDQPGVEVQGLGGPYTGGGADVNFYAQVGMPNAQGSGLIRAQSVRAGAAAPLTASFTSTLPAAGTLVDSSGVGTLRTAQVSNAGGIYYTPTGGPGQGGVAFRPVAPGSTTISVAIPGYLTMTTNGVRVVTVQ
ncbi:MAG: hypothetical protein IPL76_13530 [Gemmatimonadetes bacterium]|nr:hypothetical protein [Gemmatimonadota bacterium]